MRLCICVICVICGQASLCAATWYLDPPRAEVPAEAAGGDEIVLRPGLYLGPITIPNRLAGTEAAPTVVRPETPGTVQIIGVRPPGDALRIGTDCVYPEGAHWVIVEDLELCWSKRDGLRGYGSHCIVRRCHIHHNGLREVAPGEGRIAVPVGQGVSWFGDQRNVRFEGNLIEYNGSSAWDHGFYCYGRDHVYARNTVRWNAGAGLNLYSVTAGFVVYRNLSYGNGTYGVYAVVAPGESLAVADNVLVANGRYGLAVIGTATENVALSGNLIVSNALGVAAGGDGFNPKVVTSMPASQPAEE